MLEQSLVSKEYDDDDFNLESIISNAEIRKKYIRETKDSEI